MKEITNESEFDKLINDSEILFIYKHSNRCELSAEAMDEVAEFCANHPEVPCVYLVVQYSRELSNRIAEISGVRHQTPQVILYHRGHVIWNVSHGSVSSSSLEAQYKKIK